MSHSLIRSDEKIKDDVSFDPSEYERGMPLRGGFRFKKSEFDNNQHSDFALFAKKADDVSLDGFDPNYLENQSGGGFPRANEKIKLKTTVFETCAGGVTSLSLFLINNILLTSTMRNIYVDGLGLYLYFAINYLAAANNSEIELKNFFTFPKKEQTAPCIERFNTELDNCSDMLKQYTIVLYNCDIPIDSEYANQYKKNMMFVEVGVDPSECRRLNRILKTNFGLSSDSIIPRGMAKKGISVLNLSKISPIWDFTIDNVMMKTFQNRKELFMIIRNKEFGYHDDGQYKLLELPTMEKKIIMGVMIGNVARIDEERLRQNISKLRPTPFRQIELPIIKTKKKLRVTNLMRTCGLKAYFLKTEIPDIFPEGGDVTDMIQYTEIDIGMNSSKSKTFDSKQKTDRRIVVDTPFYYYFRLADSKSIISFGSYY